MDINLTEKDRIVTEDYLKVQMGLSSSWIAKHARACGCFARKPRRFFLANVLDHIHALASNAAASADGSRKKADKQKMEKLVEQVAHPKLMTKTPGIVFEDFYRQLKIRKKKSSS